MSVVVVAGNYAEALLPAFKLVRFTSNKIHAASGKLMNCVGSKQEHQESGQKNTG